jgi:hypothetical protein
MLAGGITDQLERIRPVDDILRSAALVDPDARALRDDLQLRQRREAMTQVVSWIAANGDLKKQPNAQAATDIVWTVTSPEVHQLLRDRCGWEATQYRLWLQETLESALLPTRTPRGRDGSVGTP